MQMECVQDLKVEHLARACCVCVCVIGPTSSLTLQLLHVSPEKLSSTQRNLMECKRDSITLKGRGPCVRENVASWTV